MKSVSYFLLIIIFTISFTSCLENGIIFPEKQNIEGNFEVTFDGTILLTSNVNFTLNDQEIIITALKAETKESFILRVVDFNEPSFSFEGEENVASYSIEDSVNTNIWTSLNATTSRGNIQFTEINFTNNTISGTFSFIGRNENLGASKAFSNGSFSNVPRK